MMYFNGVTNSEQAKLRYRNLAKHLHPDAEGTALEFQNMQDEYKTIVRQLKHYGNTSSYEHPKSRTKQGDYSKNESPEKELLSSLGKLAKILLKKQVPQNYLRQTIKTTGSSLKKDIFSELVNILDEL